MTKVFGEGNAQVRALDGINLQLERGSFTAIMGPSGSGKSTLMHCMAGLDRPTRGQVLIGGRDISRMGDADLTKVRRDQIGFIFQQFNLLPTLTAQQNIVLPLELAGRKVDKGHFRAIVESLGLEKRLKHRPSELSGGQQQRVAISRALITQPEVIFADEPTGALDSKAGHTLLAYLAQCSKRLGQTIVMVTHDPNAAAYADRALILSDGRIIEDIPRPDVDSTLHALRRLDASPHTPQAERQRRTAPVTRQMREAIMPGGPGLPRDRSGRDGRDNEETRDLPPALARSLFGNQHRPSAQDLIHTWQEETRGMEAVPQELYDNAPPQSWRGRGHDVEPPISRRDPRAYEDADPYGAQSRDPYQGRDARQGRDPQAGYDPYQSNDYRSDQRGSTSEAYDRVEDRRSSRSASDPYADRRSSRSASEYGDQRRRDVDPYAHQSEPQGRGYDHEQSWEQQQRGGFAEVPPPRPSAPQQESRGGWEPRGGDGQLRSAWQDTEATGWSQSPAAPPAPKHQPSQPYWRFEDRTGQQPAVPDVTPRGHGGYDNDPRSSGRQEPTSHAPQQSWSSASTHDTGPHAVEYGRVSGYGHADSRGRSDDHGYGGDYDRRQPESRPQEFRSSEPSWEQQSWNQGSQSSWSQEPEREPVRDDRQGYRTSDDGWNRGRDPQTDTDTFVPSYSSPAFGLGKGFTDLPAASPIYEEPPAPTPVRGNSWDIPRRSPATHSEPSPTAPYYRDLQAPHRALGQSRPSAPNLDGIDWSTPLPEKNRRREDSSEVRETYSTPRTWDEDPPAMPASHADETRWNGQSAREPYPSALPKPASSANEWGAQSRSWEMPNPRGDVASSDAWGEGPRPRRSAPEPDHNPPRPAPDWDEPRWDDRSSGRSRRYDDERDQRDGGWGSQGNDQPRRW